ncbi:MAG TPA: hypothetical protein VHT75_10580, partial [Acidimicrobiales bacterium]|nr:hypothetical protein [Acidimicrobiales bacterium]
FTFRHLPSAEAAAHVDSTGLTGEAQPSISAIRYFLARIVVVLAMNTTKATTMILPPPREPRASKWGGREERR